ncbi:MAG: AIR synthase-related protein, partial [Bacteroidales bacterium]
VSKDALFSADLDYNLRMIAMDAQTSGGLLMSVPPSGRDLVMANLQASGVEFAEIIGEVKERGEKVLYISN